MHRVIAVFVLACVIAAAASVGAQTPAPTPRPHPLYRLQPTDVLELQYRYSPEFNQTTSIGPDGFVHLLLLGAVRVGGLSVEEAQTRILELARQRLRDPEMVLILREFEKPYVTVAGHVTNPGKLELGAGLTVVQAIAVAGGFRSDAKHSQVLLFRRFSADEFETQAIDVKRLMSRKGLREDFGLRSGDLIVIPQDRISKIERFVRWANIGVYVNPAGLLSGQPQ
jgi:polysaccharide export outer membrane protein